MKKPIKIFLIIALSAIILLFIIRLISPRELDDVSPEISCPEIEKYNIDTLYIIPNYNNKPISENKEWCNNILLANKSLGLHGINHQPYREFLYENITNENLTFALSEFQKCFNQTPKKFKPPQLKISKENKILIQQNNIKMSRAFSQLTHKVYHCNDGGKIKNRWINLF